MHCPDCKHPWADHHEADDDYFVGCRAFASDDPEDSRACPCAVAGPVPAPTETADLEGLLAHAVADLLRVLPHEMEGAPRAMAAESAQRVLAKWRAGRGGGK